MECLDLAGEIASHVEFYDSDDLVGHIAQVIKPTVDAMTRLEEINSELLAACRKAWETLESMDFGDEPIDHDDRILLDQLERVITKAEEFDGQG